MSGDDDEIDALADAVEHALARVERVLDERYGPRPPQLNREQRRALARQRKRNGRAR